MFLSVKQKDEAAFERNFLQLKTFYTDARRVLLKPFGVPNLVVRCVVPTASRVHRRHLLPPSANEQIITGLNLLRLLVQNRTAEFHTELELIPAEASPNAHRLLFSHKTCYAQRGVAMAGWVTILRFLCYRVYYEPHSGSSAQLCAVATPHADAAQPAHKA